MGFATLQALANKFNQGQKWTRRFGKTINIRDNGCQTSWIGTGDPGAGGHSGAALTAASLDDTATGAILHGGNVTPATKHLLRMWFDSITNTACHPCYVILYDRLLYYPGIDATSAANQPLTNGVSLPRYTSGVGVRAWLETTTNLGANTGVFTFGTSGYTNSGGTGGRQHGVTVNTTASTVAPKIPHSGGNTANNNYNPFLPLQAGDLGIKSAESVQFTTAHTAGVVALVLGYPIATLSLPTFEVATERDYFFRGPLLPRIYDGACLDLLIYVPGTVNASCVYGGELEFAWGS